MSAARRERGIALLLALATLVLVLAGVTAGLVALRGARQSAWTSDVDARLLAGLRQGERLAAAWLAADSAGIVLPPDGGGIVLVDDRFVLPSGEGRLNVVAYDGLAGIPGCLAQRGGGLRTAMPTALMGLTVPPLSPAQADRSALLLDTLELPPGTLRFPRPTLGQGRVWSATWTSLPATRTAPPQPAPSLAEAVSFRSDGRLNLNTAPATLLRSAYALLGLGGIEEVLERRRALQATRPPSPAPASPDGLRLVAQSDRWQMLISVSWQGIHRSWWVDFSTTPQGTSMVQRHDISE